MSSAEPPAARTPSEAEITIEDVWALVEVQQHAVHEARDVLADRIADRDRTIMRLLGAGASDYAVAKRLGLAQTTIAAVRNRPAPFGD